VAMENPCRGRTEVRQEVVRIPRKTRKQRQESVAAGIG
jgi:hypothetical protein